MVKWNKDSILKRFKDLHNELYKYEDFEYTNRDQRINITCKMHGVFNQKIRKHLEGQGCKRCARTASSSKWNNPTGYRDENGKQFQYQEYTVWRATVQRSKPKYWVKHPHYTGTTISKLFSDWDSYKGWYDEQFNSSFVDDEGRPFELDKDLLSNGSRHYSEDTCCFLPRLINIRLRSKSKGLRLLTEHYKDQIDPRAYQALMEYEVNVED